MWLMAPPSVYSGIEISSIRLVRRLFFPSFAAKFGEGLHCIWVAGFAGLVG